MGPSAETFLSVVKRIPPGYPPVTAAPSKLAQETNQASSKIPTMGQMMKTYSQLLRMVDRTFQFSPIGFLALALLSTAIPATATAQTNDASGSQATSRPSQNTQAHITQSYHPIPVSPKPLTKNNWSSFAAMSTPWRNPKLTRAP